MVQQAPVVIHARNIVRQSEDTYLVHDRVDYVAELELTSEVVCSLC